MLDLLFLFTVLSGGAVVASEEAPAGPADPPAGESDSEPSGPDGTDPPALSPEPAAEATPESAPSVEVGAASSPAVVAPLPPEPVSVPLVATGYGSGVGSMVKLGAFADVSAGMVAGRPTPMFQVGQVVIHSTAVLGHGLSVFGEATLNSVPTWQARVERLLFQWESSDSFKLTVGRMHLPVTWWNSTYHHGVWLQTSASRPRIIGFDQSFVPNHHKGLMISGRTEWLSELGLRYQLGVSDGGDDDAPGDGETIPYSTALFGTLAMEPSAVPLLRLGISGYSVWELPLPGQLQGEHTLLTGAHVAHTGQRPEFIVEVVRVQHTSATAIARDAQVATQQTLRSVQSNLSMVHGTVDSAAQTTASESMHHAEGMTHTSWGGYAQLGWRPARGEERWMPYSRFELIELDSMDPTLQELDSQMVLVGGIRVDVVTTMAVKLEGNWVPAGDVPWAAQAQWSAAW